MTVVVDYLSHVFDMMIDEYIELPNSVLCLLRTRCRPRRGKLCISLPLSWRTPETGLWMFKECPTSHRAILKLTNDFFDGSVCTDYYHVSVPDKWSGHRRNSVAVDDVYIACNMGVRDTAHTITTRSYSTILTFCKTYNRFLMLC